MTPQQIFAIQSYVCSVVRVMTNDGNAHSMNVRLLLDSKLQMEKAFGIMMPVEHDYPDLFASPATPALPDIL